jgi:hypothetical protein
MTLWAREVRLPGFRAILARRESGNMLADVPMNHFVMHHLSEKSSARWSLAAALLVSTSAGLAACNSRSKAQPACDATPPAYIDIDVCSQLVDDQTTARSTECDTCCQNAGFSEYSFACNQHCTCGDPPTVNDTETCATEVASSEVCSTCCTNAGYHLSTRTAAACTCVGQPDNDQICAATLDLPDPGQACPNCCLNNGFLKVNYFALTRQCTCSG